MDADILIGPVIDPYMTMLGSHFLWRDGYGIPIKVHTVQKLSYRVNIFSSEQIFTERLSLQAVEATGVAGPLARREGGEPMVTNEADFDTGWPPPPARIRALLAASAVRIATALRLPLLAPPSGFAAPSS